MNQVKKRKLSAIEAIKYNCNPYLEIEDLWQALYKSFNSAQHWQVSVLLLEEIPNKFTTEQLSFLKEEFISSINKYSNDSTPESDKLSWRYFKIIVKNWLCLNNVINIANAYIDLGYQLSHFKMSTSVIIPKSNKALYDTPKLFRPIILLNILGKLIKKAISKKL